jgi:hypothetical protein
MGAGLKPPPSGVDTLVAAVADERAAGDFQMLGSVATNAARLSILLA